MNFLSELVNGAEHPNVIVGWTNNVDTHKITDWPPM